MARGRAPMIVAIVLGIAVVLSALIVAWRVLIGKRVPGYLAVAEYWVYATTDNLPDQRALMERVLRGNPHNKPHRAAIDQREGLLFSDIRLHLGLAKKARNPHIFRPDVLDEDVVPSKEILTGLAKATAMIKVRYLSEAKLVDSRHLQFTPHLADAVSQMTGGTVVFDRISDQIWTAEDFFELLQRNPNCERPEFHVRVVWKETEAGATAQSLGLRKVGRWEIRTEPQEEDHQVLMTGLLMRAAFQIVRHPEDEGPYEFEEFGDTFVLTLGAKAEGFQTVKVERHQVRS
ncbi:MAG: hypothetical protein ABUL72_06150 [Armatimonadota bacterium]